jgi:hypothetical protein
MNRDSLIKFAKEADREWDCDRNMVEWLECFARLLVDEYGRICIDPTDLYHFAGWLTARNGVMQVGRSCDASPVASATKEYIETYPEYFKNREWISLTEADIYELMENEDEFDFARAIEAKLKEKNT